MNINASSGFRYAQMLMQSAAGRADKGSAANADFSVNVTEVEVVEKAGEPQTVEEVKKEFYDYLDSLSLSPGLSTTPISVNITEAAFEKMLADPEYKQKMKDLCARDLCDPAWGTTMLPSGRPLVPSAMVVTIDADVDEEYIASSYNHPQDSGKADGDGFWSRRTKKDKKAAKKADEKRAQEKREMLEFLQERADERKRATGVRGDYSSRDGVSSYQAYASTWSQDNGGGVSGLL